MMHERAFWIGWLAGVAVANIGFWVGCNQRRWVWRLRKWRAKPVIDGLGEDAGRAIICSAHGTVMVDRKSGRCGQLSHPVILWVGWRRGAELRVMFHYEGGGCESLPWSRVRAALASERAGYLSRMGSEHGKEGDAPPGY